MIWAGAGVLWIAARAEVAPAVAGATAYQNAAWQTAYLVMAASMLVGVVTVLFSKEPAQVALPPAKNAADWLRGALVEPFAEFIRRYRWQAALILALIAVYRISDVVMGIMANPFYVDMGYTKDEVAAVTKVYGVIMTLAGAFLGGALSMKFGVMRVLMLGAILSAASNLLFAWLGGVGHDVTALIFVISADNLSSGIASAAFIAYLSSLTNVTYSATQFAPDGLGLGKRLLASLDQIIGAQSFFVGLCFRIRRRLGTGIFAALLECGCAIAGCCRGCSLGRAGRGWSRFPPRRASTSSGRWARERARA